MTSLKLHEEIVVDADNGSEAVVDSGDVWEAGLDTTSNAGSGDDEGQYDDDDDDDDVLALVLPDQVVDTSQDEMLFGTSGGDLVFGFAGTDHIMAGAGADAAGAGAETAFVTGATGWDVFVGEDDDDDLFGANEIDGDDTAGSDTFGTNNAVSIVDGGAGQEKFEFGSATVPHDVTISGFEPGDTIDLSVMDANSGASGTGTFTLESGQSTTAPGQIVVMHETGVDGEDDTTPELDSSLAGSHALTADDFNV